MFFNADKCKVLHIGNRNVQANYMMNGIQLAKVEQEKDLVVAISSDLKPSKQCSEVVKTANKFIRFIGRSFEFRTEEIILYLYSALVRPHLEYCVQCWSSYYKKDIEKLEGVQQRVTKLYFTTDTSNITRNNVYKTDGKRFQTSEAKHFSSIKLLMYGMVYHPTLSIVPQLRYSKLFAPI